MRNKDTKIKCPHCGGTGHTVDPRKQGAVLRQERQSAGLSQQKIAAKMGISHNYLCDLEKGNRPLTDERCVRYRRAIKELTAK